MRSIFILSIKNNTEMNELSLHVILKYNILMQAKIYCQEGKQYSFFGLAILQ